MKKNKNKSKLSKKKTRKLLKRVDEEEFVSRLSSAIPKPKISPACLIECNWSNNAWESAFRKGVPTPPSQQVKSDKSIPRRGTIFKKKQ